MKDQAINNSITTLVKQMIRRVVNIRSNKTLESNVEGKDIIREINNHPVTLGSRKAHIVGRSKSKYYDTSMANDYSSTF